MAWWLPSACWILWDVLCDRSSSHPRFTSAADSSFQEPSRKLRPTLYLPRLEPDQEFRFIFLTSVCVSRAWIDIKVCLKEADSGGRAPRLMSCRRIVRTKAAGMRSVPPSALATPDIPLGSWHRGGLSELSMRANQIARPRQPGNPELLALALTAGETTSHSEESRQTA